MAIHRARKVAITDGGQECPFTNLYDREGDEVDDAMDAISAVCQLPSGQWAAIDLTQFDPVTVH
jgi:hypothetical protein